MSAGIAALGFAAGVNLDGAPAALREAAEEAGLPLFEVGYEVPFRSITSYIFSSLLSSDMHRLRRSLSVQNHLLTLMMEEKGAAHLVSSLAMLLSATIILFDEAGTVVSLAQERLRADADVITRVWAAYVTATRGRDLPRELALDDMHLVFREVRTHGRIQRVLTLALPTREHLTEFADVILTYAQKLVALDLLKHRDSLLVQRKLRADLLAELTAGSAPVDDLSGRLTAYGLDPGLPMRVLVLEAVDLAEALAAAGSHGEEQLQDTRDLLQAHVEEAFAELRLPAISMSRSDTVVLLFEEGETGIEAIRSRLAALSGRPVGRAEHPRIAGGLSEPFSGAAGVQRAHAQAREALRVARAGGHGDIVFFGDLGPSVRSLENQTAEQLELIYASTVKPLVEHDLAHGDDLVGTLTAYLEEGRSVSRAASRLFVHQNTLRYRLKKIETLLGIDLDETEALVDLFLGLRSRGILHDRSSSSAAPPPLRTG